MGHDWVIRCESLGELQHQISEEIRGEGWYEFPDKSFALVALTDGMWAYYSYTVDPRPEMRRVLGFNCVFKTEVR